jgi:hypothetical protein
MLLIVEGIEMIERDEQLWKAESSKQESWQPEANVTCEREEQSLKQSGPIALTVEGMQIANSDEQ